MEMNHLERIEEL